MPTNENGGQLCVSLIENYGVCGRRLTHPIHQKLGITPLEHSFFRERSGVEEEMVLSRRNIKKIARRSGQSRLDLERMRQLAKKQGRILTLKYDVVPEEVDPEILKTLGGVEAPIVIMDETQGFDDGIR